MSRQAFVVSVALAMSAAACGRSTSAVAPFERDGHAFTEADFRTLARLFWTKLSDDSKSIQLTVGFQSYLDERGALIEDHRDPRWIFRHRGEVFSDAFVALRNDPKYKARFDAVEEEIVAAIPDGASETVGHKIAYGALLKAGLLQLIVDRASPATITVPPDELADPNIWGRNDLPILRGADTVWDGSQAALQFHCCKGVVVVSVMTGELEKYTLAYRDLSRNDPAFRRMLEKTVKPYSEEADALPHDRDGVEKCDNITTRLRTSLKDAGVLKAIEEQATQYAANVSAKR